MKPAFVNEAMLLENPVGADWAAYPGVLTGMTIGADEAVYPLTVPVEFTVQVYVPSVFFVAVIYLPGTKIPIVS